MLMLEGKPQIRRSELNFIPTPEATPTWQPVGHAEVADGIIAKAKERGLAVANEQWMVRDGAMRDHGTGDKTPVPNGRLYGSVDFAPIADPDLPAGLEIPSGLVPSIGVRNSIDKSCALTVLSGARVVVCSNGMLVGEHTVSRKHTHGISVPAQIDQAFDAFMQATLDIAEMHAQMKATDLTGRQANHLIVEAARAGAFSSGHILPVVDTYDRSATDKEFRGGAFADRNAWSLYNAATEVMKRQSPGRQSAGFTALNSVLLAA